MNTELHAKPSRVSFVILWCLLILAFFDLGRNVWFLFLGLPSLIQTDLLGVGLEILRLAITLAVWVFLLFLLWGATRGFLRIEKGAVETRIPLLSRPLWSFSLRGVDRLEVRPIAWRARWRAWWEPLWVGPTYTLLFSETNTPLPKKTVFLPTGRTDTDPETLAFVESIRNEVTRANTK